MTTSLTFVCGKADVSAIAAHLRACDSGFVPPLSARVDIVAFAVKIATWARRFEAYVGDDLVGLVAIYCNATDRETAFVTSVSVLPSWQGRGIASRLMLNAITHVRALGFARLALEVGALNAAAIWLYVKYGFVQNGEGGDTARMILDLKRNASMGRQRD